MTVLYRRASIRQRIPRRAVTVQEKRLTRASVGLPRYGRIVPPPSDPDRPKTRGDCIGGERPCPWVSCKWHTYLSINPETGTIQFVRPDLEVWELTESCALDVADRGGSTLEEVGEVLNVTRERARQLEITGLIKLRRKSEGLR